MASSQAALKTALAAVSGRFPALPGLHARASLAWTSVNNPDHPLKIAIMPIGLDRTLLKRVLDSLVVLDLPVPYSKLSRNDLKWHEAVTGRALGKDTKVEGSNQVRETISNAIQFYAVPSPFLLTHNVNLIECVSTPESNQDLLEPCHLHLLIFNNLKSIDQPIHSSIVPTHPVLDLDHLSTAQSSSSQLSSATVISSSTATETGWTDDSWPEISNIQSLGNLISNRHAIINGLIQSIINTCESYIAASKSYVTASLNSPVVKNEQDTRDIVAARKEWARTAHTELRDVLDPGLNRFATATAWWKLYWVLDDLETDIVDRHVYDLFLPTSEKSLLFVLGQLSTIPSVKATVSLAEPKFEPLSSPSQHAISKIGTSISNAKQLVRESLLPALHYKAQNLVVSTFFLTQLPVTSISLAGWYWYDYSFYSAGGLALLAWVLGFKKIQSRWDKLVSEFHQQVHDTARTAIEKSEVEIFKAWEAKISDMESRISEQQQVVDTLKKHLNYHK
ncbi:hypothetical protein V1514DRAFT_326287 [Lipomyces japonicus]|uniref:uncharacterized protein n=1 Tax=Lipomyces japonicus TaxID=56871 RepID=UPI0034CF20A8